MEIFDTLYARDSQGRINQWDILAREFVPIFHVNMGGQPIHSIILISEGLIDGIKTEVIKKIWKGKNIGKMNETTHYEQAYNEAKSRWERKRKQGYKSLLDLGYLKDNTWTIEELDIVLEKELPNNRTDINNLSKPMKAQPYFKDNGQVRIKFPAFGQPKLNGFRVIARWEKIIEGEGIFRQEVERVVFRSKEGLRYDILEHIEQEFNSVMFFNTSTRKHDLAFDGEMYIHGEILSEISSAVRKRNNKTSRIRFCIFDIAIEEVRQLKRLVMIDDLYIDVPRQFINIEFVPHKVINSNEEAQLFTDECIKQGYEGAIFRDMKAFYCFGQRPQTMVKLKRSQDKEFKIVDVKSGDNSPDLGVFVCVQEEGLQFSCTPEGTQETKREYLTNKEKYIGKMLTVKFFERTKDNKPNHAIGIAIRDYE